MEKSIDVLSVGILVHDVFGKTIDRFPQPGTSVFFDDLEVHPGGCAFNTGVDLARMGARVRVGGKVGRDAFGECLLRELEREGVDTRNVRVSDTVATSFSFIMVPPSGNRRIYTSMGASAAYAPADIDPEEVRSARIFHVGGSSMMTALDGAPTAEILRFARQAGTVTCLDPVCRENTRELLRPCLPHLDYFFPNNDESVHLTGLTEPLDQLRYYLDAGVRVAGIKLGAGGCLLSDGRRLWKLGVYSVPVADTCGAGDAFVAGFLFGVCQGWEIPRCGAFATAAAAFCIRSVGAVSAIPSAAVIEDFIQSHPLTAEELTLS